MPSFAANLEKTLHAALTDAGERRHEYATLEHLLLALIDDAAATGSPPTAPSPVAHPPTLPPAGT